MDLEFEEGLVQNIGVGAHLLFEFALAYFNATDQREGPDLPTSLLVLPMVFNERTTAVLKRKKRQSGLLSALVDGPEIPAGLQARVESLAGTSLRALNVCVGAKLCTIDRDVPWPRYIPTRKTTPSGLTPADDDVKAMVAASKRLGWWFAEEDLLTLCRLLHVRF